MFAKLGVAMLCAADLRLCIYEVVHRAFEWPVGSMVTDCPDRGIQELSIVPSSYGYNIPGIVLTCSSVLLVLLITFFCHVGQHEIE